MVEEIEKGNCETHGEYDFKYIDMIGIKKVFKNCPQCAILERDRLEAERIESEKKRAIHFATEKRLDSGISKRNLGKKFDDYIAVSSEQKKALESCKKFAENFPKSNNLLMLGSVGTGKTLLASAIIESLIHKYNCRLIKLIDIFRMLKDTFRKGSENSEKNIIEYLTNVPLLIIDEVGVQFDTDTEKMFVFDVIDGRYQAVLPTILISNLDIDGVKKVIGERCLDRLREDGGSMVAFNWDSHR
jgi:DNA replication protein DnaC